MKCSGHRKLLCAFSKLSRLNAFHLLGLKFVYKSRPEGTCCNMYAKYTRPQLTFLALVPCVRLIIEKNTAAGLPTKHET